MRVPAPIVLFRAATGAIVAAAFFGAGCLAPTLPLPPPESPDGMRPLGDGSWLVSGTCSPGALVTVLVERDGVGAVVEDRDANGRYAVAVDATRCDTVLIWQQDGDETSATQRVVLQEVANGTAVDPNECVR